MTAKKRIVTAAMTVLIQVQTTMVFWLPYFPAYFCAQDGEDDGGEHPDRIEDRAEPHVSDHNPEHQCHNDRLRCGLLRDLIGRSGDDVALERTVAFEDICHIPDLQGLFFLTCTYKVFGSVDPGYTDADQDDPDETDQQAYTARCREESLIVCTIRT